MMGRKRKLVTGLITMVLALVLFAAPATAALVEYDNAESPAWGSNGGGEKDTYEIDLNNLVDDMDLITSIASAEVVFDNQSEIFKPQLICNTETGGWKQEDHEITELGETTLTIDLSDFSADDGWNQLFIKSGWKNEGDVSLVSVVFKNADGEVVYTLGDGETAVPAEITEDGEDAQANSEKEAAPAPEALPKTGIASMGLIYGLGAITLGGGSILLKGKKEEN